MSAISDATIKFIAAAELLHQLTHGSGEVDIGGGVMRPTFDKIALDFLASSSTAVANKADKTGENASGSWDIEAATVAEITEAQVLEALGMTPISVDEIGAVGGICELDSNQLVPAIRLPSYVDDVIEVATFGALPVTGSSGKLYIVVTDTDTKTNQYRWTGSTYAKIPQSPGTTDDVVEGTAKYFTTARVLATVLAGLSLTDGSATTAADTILVSIGKLQKQISNIPYDIAGSMPSKPAVSEQGTPHIAVRAFTLPANLTGSAAYVDVAGTGAVTIQLMKGATQFGSINFAAGANVGTFTAASSTTFAAGDRVRPVAPATQDATFSGLSYTLAGLLA